MPSKIMRLIQACLMACSLVDFNGVPVCIDCWKHETLDFVDFGGRVRCQNRVGRDLLVLRGQATVPEITGPTFCVPQTRSDIFEFRKQSQSIIAVQENSETFEQLFLYHHVVGVDLKQHNIKQWMNGFPNRYIAHIMKSTFLLNHG